MQSISFQYPNPFVKRESERKKTSILIYIHRPMPVYTVMTLTQNGGKNDRLYDNPLGFRRAKKTYINILQALL